MKINTEGMSPFGAKVFREVAEQSLIQAADIRRRTKRTKAGANETKRNLTTDSSCKPKESVHKSKDEAIAKMLLVKGCAKLIE